MLRFIKIVILGALMAAIVVLALANREMVTLNLLPAEVKQILPLSIKLPMFLVILASVLSGLMLGYIMEWLRESKHRRLAARKQREASELSREVKKLKKTNLSTEEEVLSILGQSPRNA